MEQNSKIIAVHVINAADFVFVPLFKEDQTKNLAIHPRKLLEKLTHGALPLLVYKLRLRVGALFSRIQTAFRQRNMPGSYAIMLGQHMITYRIHEGAQLFRVGESPSISQDTKHTQESFLPDILYGLWRTHALTKLDLQQLAEVIRKVTLDIRVALSKALNVLNSEPLKLQV